MRVALRSLLFLCLLAAAHPARAQQEGLLPLGDDVHRFLLRQQASGRLPGVHLVHLPLSAYEARTYLDSLATRPEALTPRDQALLARFRGAAPGPGAAWIHRRVPLLYADGTRFFSVRGDGYALEVEPLLYFAYGRARVRPFDDATRTQSVWQNTRGVRAGGHLGRHVFFETSIEETQERVPFPARTSGTAPRLPFVRDGGAADVYDYQLATGIVGFRSRFFEARFGRAQNQWGEGAASLFLSNYAPAYDALHLRTSVWRLQYVNLFAALHDRSPTDGPANRLLPRKYASFHHLSIAVTDRIRVGFFQGVVFATDTTDARRRSNFDISYLNPVLFLRPAEADRGSADNMLLGAEAAVQVWRGRVYGQLLLDEFKASELGAGWWGNKYGWLVGAELADVGPAVLVRLEYARLRPYLYSHRTPLNAYTHHNDVLGHPAGPNTSSLAAFVHARPLRRTTATLALFRVARGRNTATENYGSDPLLSYNTRVRDDEVRLLQGVRQRTLQAEATLAYELLPELHAGLALRAEYEDDDLLGRRAYLAPSMLLRWGLPYRFLSW